MPKDGELRDSFRILAKRGQNEIIITSDLVFYVAEVLSTLKK